MPQTPISCVFKVLKRITTPLCFGWIKKKNILSISGTLPVDMLLFLSCLGFGFEQRLVTSWRNSFQWLVVWSQQKNYLQNTLCQLTVQRAHKQDHLAIISSQSQIHTAKRAFIKKNGRLVGEEENRTGGERGQEERGEGGGGYWSQGGVMVSQWREVVENIRNFHCGIPCNWVI